MYSNEMVCDVLEYINTNINKEISINDLCDVTYYNRTYIMKRFKKELNISINNYINYLKIYNCLSFFKYNKTILNIAFNSGFNSLEYFSETFKKIIGVSPIIYKQYINRTKFLSSDLDNQIIENINNLYLIKNNADNYLSKRKPKITPEKKFFL